MDFYRERSGHLSIFLMNKKHIFLKGIRSPYYPRLRDYKHNIFKGLNSSYFQPPRIPEKMGFKRGIKVHLLNEKICKSVLLSGTRRLYFNLSKWLWAGIFSYFSGALNLNF